MNNQVYFGDCLEILDTLPRDSVDLVYIDPPFFTQTVHKLVTRDGSKAFNFADIWDSDNSYADFIFQRLSKVRDSLKSTGSIFFHCDKSASHIIRLLLDSVFGAKNFQSEIIWHFRRWSNSKRGLLNGHQTIYFYSKDSNYKFNILYSDYSPSTNIDQIMQKRSRDDRNKSVYAKDKAGNIVGNGVKKGVPLSDVWEIPFLNPKAKERVGYPTQKPVLLLQRIIELTTEPGDVVLDPFCGSGTTLVAAQTLQRNAIGIDISEDA
ncbi:MAG: DNA methyltransferase, partial [Pseudomonadota bacterium]